MVEQVNAKEFRFRILDFGFRILDFGFLILDSRIQEEKLGQCVK